MPEPVTRISRPAAWRAAFIRQHDYRCHYCNRFAGAVDAGPDGKPWHVDHKVALANGGADAEENLALACERCNLVKHTLPYKNFLAIAHSVFWATEPQRIQDSDLEELTSAFLQTSDGTWLVRNQEDRYQPYKIHTHHDEEIDDSADLVVGHVEDGGGQRGGYYDARFIVLAHRLMPKLIAEIHFLRAAAASKADADEKNDAA